MSKDKLSNIGRAKEYPNRARTTYKSLRRRAECTEADVDWDAVFSTPVAARECEEVIIELHRAQAKFGPFPTSHHGYAVIKEEVDELWDAVKKNQPIQARAEAVQVAAMAIRFIIDSDNGFKSS